MPNLYVWSGGSNTSPYDTWAKAATSPATAIAACAAGDTIYQHAETFTITGSTLTWVFPAGVGVRWICSNDTANAPPLTLSTAGVVSFELNHGQTAGIRGLVYIYGLRFKAGVSTNANYLNFASNFSNLITLDSCFLECAGSSTATTISLGANSTATTGMRLLNTSVKFANASQYIAHKGPFTWEGSTILESGSTVPTKLFGEKNTNGGWGDFFGDDFSGMTSGTMFSFTPDNAVRYTLAQCKMGAATLTNTLTLSGQEVTLYDCSSADQHYHLAHYAYNGSTVVSTAIYADDGAAYNVAGTKHSWLVSGNANTSRANPYRSPWISRYNEATSAKTPSIEILRDGSTTAYTDVQVWGEWMVKVGSNSPLGTLYNDRGGHLSSGTNQDAGVGLSGWTGEAGSAWSGKLVCQSVSPTKIGHVSARVVVAANIAVYADPTVRGL